MVENGQGDTESRAKSRLEFAAALVGAALALLTLGVIVWDGLTGTGRPPLVTLRAESVHQRENMFVVGVVATNSGGETAADLHIEGVLRQAGEEVETSEATLDYVPRQSEKRGGLVFTLDPRRYDLRLRVKGYMEP